MYYFYCIKCNKSYDIDYIMNSKDYPRCQECLGLIKPDVVLYEEGLNENTIQRAISAIMTCDTLIIIVRGLVTSPLKSLITFAK